MAALLPMTTQANSAEEERLYDDVAAALARFRSSIPSNFNHEYVERVMVPYFLGSIYQGERPNCR